MEENNNNNTEINEILIEAAKLTKRKSVAADELKVF